MPNQSKQKYTSAKTCVNQVPAAFKKIPWKPNQDDLFNLDYGGGKYQTATDYLKSLGIINLVYDPYNRSEEHNKGVLKAIKFLKGIDSVTCCNVLNVIKEKQVRLEVIKHIKSLIRPCKPVYFSVYRGTGNKGTKTCNGWQNNKPLKYYLNEVKEVFPNAMIYDNMILCSKYE